MSISIYTVKHPRHTSTMNRLMIWPGYPSTSRMKGYATDGGGPMMTMICECVSGGPPTCCACGRTEGIKWMIRPGSGDLPVGQLDAQNRFPNGRGIPSLASSDGEVSISSIQYFNERTLVDTRCCESHCNDVLCRQGGLVRSQNGRDKSLSLP